MVRNHPLHFMPNYGRHPYLVKGEEGGWIRIFRKFFEVHQDGQSDRPAATSVKILKNPRGRADENV